MASAQGDGRERAGRGVGDLLRELADSGGQLVRQEVRLAGVELGGVARAVGAGTAQVALGAVLALLGTLSIFIGIIMLVGDQWLRDRYWLAALIVALLVGGVAAWLAMRGRKLLTPKQLTPDQTAATLKEDKEWLKRQLKSGATSS